MTTTGTELLTADDLLRLHSRGIRGELTRGVLHETMASGVEHGEIVMHLGRHLGNFIAPQRLGRVIGSDSGVRLERDPDTVREPDIAFISAKRMPLSERVSGYSEIVPDLVVEIVSPSDDSEDVFNKARMWLSYGVRLVWVVHPETRSVDVHRSAEPVEVIGEGGALDGLDVLPGFRCSVGAIFGS